MTDMHVTMRTLQAFMVGCRGDYYIMDEILMAVDAIGLQDVGVLLVNADWFVKVLKGEAFSNLISSTLRWLRQD